MTNRFKSALESYPKGNTSLLPALKSNWAKVNNDTIILALRIAERLTEEPSEEMILVSLPNNGSFVGNPEALQESKDRWLISQKNTSANRFKAMAAQLIKECGDE